MCLGNGAIVLAVLLSKSMRSRKEMLLVAGLSAADFIYGLGTMLAGVMRAQLQYTGHLDDPVTPWTCMGFPSTIMFAVGQQTIGALVIRSRYLTVTISIFQTICDAVPSFLNDFTARKSIDLQYLYLQLNFVNILIL